MADCQHENVEEIKDPNTGEVMFRRCANCHQIVG